MTAILREVAYHSCPLPILTSSAVGPVAAQLTHLTGCSMKALMAAALPIAQEPVLALSMARTHPTQTPRAWLTQCAEEAGAAVRYLRGGDARRGPAQARTDVKGKQNVKKGESILGPQSHRTKQVGPREMETALHNPPHRPHSEGQSWTQLLSLGLADGVISGPFSSPAPLSEGMAIETNTGPSDFGPLCFALLLALCFTGLTQVPALPLPLKSNPGSSSGPPLPSPSLWLKIWG